MPVRNEECSFLSFGLLIAVAWHFGVGAAPKIYLIDPASMETGEILRRFFPLRSHLQVFMSTVGVATRHCLWSLKSVMVSKMSRSSRYYTCTFWMVNFHTFKGRWGIPNICYIIFKQRQTHFVSKRFRKWLLCQAKLPNGGKYESWWLAKSMIASTMASHFQVSVVRFRYPSMGFYWIQHPAVGCDFFKPCRWFCDARNLHLMPTRRVRWCWGLKTFFKLPSQNSNCLQVLSEKDLISQYFSKPCHRFWLLLVTVVTLNTWKSHTPKAWY